MENLVAISRCIKRLNNIVEYEFHFKGVYLGSKIKRIIVNYYEKDRLEDGCDYIIYLSHIEIEESILRGDVWRIKKIDQIFN